MFRRIRTFSTAAATTVVVMTIAVGPIAAQEVGARRGTGVTSPDIGADRRVTFRGTEDAAVKGARTLRDTLTAAGIAHTYVETPGGHYWNVWRRYLRDLSPLLFR